MANTKIFADLMQVTKSLEAELGLDGLTYTDQQVLASIVLISDDGKREALLSELKAHTLTKNIPTPTLYRSLKASLSAALL